MPTELPNEKTLFLRAIEIGSASARAAYLDEACGTNRVLRARVEALLRQHNQPQRLLDAAQTAAETDDASAGESPGTLIGPYKIREQLGEGGFGIVYVAEQETPVRRKVALKIIKPGMDSKEIIARFEAERQALAMMDHPHIAKVLDAGTTDSGLPYFVMELVHGIPITELCDEHTLSTPERLKLFLDVCSAVQHAHQKGIIHRDLKPSNVMVTLHDDKAIVKVIDFGVAKALSQRLTEKTVYTAYGQLVGTPMYMSPEQAQLSGLDVDTRSDVYSLGVLLYELLTGTTPFDKDVLQKATFDELRRIITESEPPRPSAKVSTLQAEQLSTVSSRRRIDPRKLSLSLRGELDWIVMKALEKDRNRRYESVRALSDDIERHLKDEPVEASPPSVGYRLRKFVRRNRGAVVAISALAITLIAGIAGTTLGMIRANAATETARQDAERAGRAEQLAKERLVEVEHAVAKATAVSDLVLQMFASADPHSEASKDYTVRELLDRFSGSLDDGLEEQPDVEAEIQRVIGLAYRNLRFYPPADQHLKRSLELHRSVYGERHRLYARAALDYATSLIWQSKTDEGVSLANQALAVCREQEDDLGELEALSLLHQTAVFFGVPAGKTQEIFDELMDVAAEGPAAESPKLGVSIHNHAIWKFKGGELEEAESLARQALEVHQVVDGAEHPETAFGWMYLGNILFAQKKHDEAERAYRKSLTIFDQNFDDIKQISFLVGRIETILSEQARTDDLASFRKTYPQIPRDVPAHKPLSNSELRTWIAYLLKCGDSTEILNGLVGLGFEVIENDLTRLDQDATASFHQEVELAHARFVLGDLAKTAGRNEEAIRFWRQGLEGIPSPWVDYKLRIETPGLYRLYVRWGGTSASADSFYVRISELSDGPDGEIADWYCFHFWPGGDTDFATIPWQHWCSGFESVNGARGPAIWSIPKAGDYTLRFMMREDGTMMDSFIFQLASLPAPTGDGPDITPREQMSFLELEGRIVAEAEDCSVLGPPIYGDAWRVQPDAETPTPSAKNFRGRGYLQVLPDGGQFTYIATLRAPRPRKDWLAKQLERANRLHQDMSNESGFYGWRGNLYFELGRMEEALADFERFATQPTNSEDLNSYAWSLIINPGVKPEQAKLAVKMAQKAVDWWPIDSRYWNTLGVAQYRAGEWEKAITSFRTASEIDRGWYFHYHAVFIAMSHWQLGHREEAREWYDAAVAWANSTWDNNELRRFRKEAAELLQLHDPPNDGKNKSVKLDRIQLLSRVLDLDPEAGWAFAERGALFAERGDLAKAAEDFAQAVELKPEFFDFYRLALARLGSGDLEAYRRTSQVMLEQFAETEDSNIAYFTLWTSALAPEALDSWDQTLELAERFGKKEPDAAHLREARGAILYRAGRFAEAEEELKAADRLRQKVGTPLAPSPYGQFFLSMACFRMEHEQEALDWLNKAVTAMEDSLRKYEEQKEYLLWNRRLTLDLLRHEAESLIRPVRDTGKKQNADQPKVGKS